MKHFKIPSFFHEISADTIQLLVSRPVTNNGWFVLSQEKQRDITPAYDYHAVQILERDIARVVNMYNYAVAIFPAAILLCQSNAWWSYLLRTAALYAPSAMKRGSNCNNFLE